MSLQSEKLKVIKMILDTDDESIIFDIKLLFKNRRNTINGNTNLDIFYRGFTDEIREIKLSLDGKVELKAAKNWLNEL